MHSSLSFFPVSLSSSSDQNCHGRKKKLQLYIIESNGAKESNSNGDVKLIHGANGTNLNEDADDFTNQPSTTAQRKKRHHYRCLRTALYAVLVLLGQSAATLLGRLYYQKGGKSKLMGTFVQFVGFPILLLFYCIPASKHPSPTKSIHNNKQPSLLMLAFVYVSLGLLFAAHCYLFSVGLSYLPVSTFSLISSSQLAFNAFFSFFLNSLKFTPYIINSILLLTISSILLVFQTGSFSSSSSSAEISTQKYVMGFICTVGASAGFGLLLSLTQLAFNKVLKRETFRVILDMVVYQSLVATVATLVGFFASEEFRGLKAEMEGYEMGKVGYVVDVSLSAIAWQVFNMGSLGLILEVTSLFSVAVEVLGMTVVPILGILFFHDRMNGLKVISLVLALWGFLSYAYQQYLDQTSSHNTEHKNSDGFSKDSQSQGITNVC